MIFRRRKRRRLDERVEQASAEAELSRQRLHDVRRDVIKPLNEAAERNQFAAMIRASLAEGYGGNRR